MSLIEIGRIGSYIVRWNPISGEVWVGRIRRFCVDWSIAVETAATAAVAGAIGERLASETPKIVSEPLSIGRNDDAGVNIGDARHD